MGNQRSAEPNKRKWNGVWTDLNACNCFTHDGHWAWCSCWNGNMHIYMLHLSFEGSNKLSFETTHVKPTHPFIHASTHASIHTRTLPSIRPSTHTYFHPPIHPSIHLSHHTFIHLSTHPHIQPSMHQSIHTCLWKQQLATHWVCVLWDHACKHHSTLTITMSLFDTAIGWHDVQRYMLQALMTRYTFSNRSSAWRIVCIVIEQETLLIALKLR